MSLEFVENREDRCPVVLLLDTSQSMLVDGRMDELNAAVQDFRAEILKDPVVALRLDIGMVSFGNGGVEVVEVFKSALDFEATPLVAGGLTPLGGGVKKALELVEDRKASYRANGIAYFRPWIWIMSAGHPTDNGWQVVAAQARKAEADKKLQIYAVGIGEDADMSVLAQFTSRLPMKLKGLHFREMFKWLSASAARVSVSRPRIPDGWGSVVGDDFGPARDDRGTKTGSQVTLPPTDGWSTPISAPPLTLPPRFQSLDARRKHLPASTASPSPVFISYATADRQTALNLVAAMEAQGVHCWYAPRNVAPGQDYQAAIVEAIEACETFVVLISDASNASAHVASEVAIAGDDGKRIIWLSMSGATPKGAMRFRLVGRQGITQTSDLNLSVIQIVEAIR